jgi:SAM-dependent methyltransferase
MTSLRERVRQLYEEYQRTDNPLGWFEALYAAANNDTGQIPWADLSPNPNLLEWLDREQINGADKKALVVGCGLGDDAEALARYGFAVTAFDISPTAVAWCSQRFPNSNVIYITADLLNPPVEWRQNFDFVLESYTLQAITATFRPAATRQLAGLVSENGQLLVICRGRNAEDDPGVIPQPLTRQDLQLLIDEGLREIAFEDYLDPFEDSPVRRFRILYQR